MKQSTTGNFSEYCIEYCNRVSTKQLLMFKISDQVNVEAFVQNKLILPKQPQHDPFLQVLANVFRFSCWFGIMGSKRVVWRLWTVVVLFFLIVVEVNAIWKVIKALAGWAIDTVGHRSVTARLAGTFFYTVSISSLILCSRLALSWKELSAYWISVERALPIIVPPDHLLKRRMIGVICFMTTFCFIEHIMSILSLVGFDCPPEEILRRYTLLSHGFMILRHEYADWMAFPILIISTLATALWNYQDLMIVLISMGLTSRYHRLNTCVAKISSLEKKEMKGNRKTATLQVYTWRKIREAYVKQANLVRKMDKSLGAMIILSCFCNFYFICLQLFMGITQGKSSSNLRRLFFLISLAWFATRVSSVVLAASDINVHSKNALKYIYNCDAYCFNVEMERLQTQLTKDFVTLSGMGFFYLNRSILLQMAGAIITYELMLIQFDDGGFNNDSILPVGNDTTLKPA